MLSLIIVLSIFVAVAIGYKAKINVGVIAIAFAYIFGVFVLGMDAGDVVDMWPTSLFFFIMMASFFYGIAVTNGTLGLLSEHAIYAFRNKPFLIPVMMWLSCFILSGLGPGPTTIFAFMPAIILGMSDRVIVMRGGEVMAEVDRDSEHFNQEDLMKAAWGGKLDD